MRIPKLFWIILLMVTPWGVCELITWLTFGHHFYEAIPLWSDELCYWHESLSFASVGLKMGYSTFSEHIPAWSCFGPHGLGATLLYTPMAMLCGANYDFITITNLLLLTLALFFFSRHLASKIDFLFIITLTAIYPPPIFIFTNINDRSRTICTMHWVWHSVIQIYKVSVRKMFCNNPYLC